MPTEWLWSWKVQCLWQHDDNGNYLVIVSIDTYMVLTLYLPLDKNSKVKGLAAPSNLSMNQTLEGHSGIDHKLW